MIKHGMRQSRLYKVWQGMKKRCLNPNASCYEYYGGQGVTVCDDWMEFLPFANWSYSHGYDEKAEKYQCTLDRINRDLGYSPENCRLVDSKTQARNKSNNRLITIGDKSMIADDWSKISGVKTVTITSRLDAGWSNEDAVFKPVHTTKKYEYNGQILTLKEWAETDIARSNDLSYVTLQNRIKRGWTIQKALTKPKHETMKKRKYVYNNQLYSLTELAKLSGVKMQTLQGRIDRYGWDIIKAVETPVNGKRV